MAEKSDLLIVDDSADFAAMLCMLGTRLGLGVRVAGSAAEFFRLYAERIPNITTMDLGLPDSNGFELIRWLSRADYAGRLIVISGQDPQVFKEHKIFSELDGKMDVRVLGKPFDLKELRVALTAGIPDGRR